MSNLESAYQSLDNAKREEQALREKRQSLDDIYDAIKPYCGDYTRCRTIPQSVESCQNDRKTAVLNILAGLAVYVLVFGIMDLIAVYFFDNTGMITSSIGAGIGSFTVGFRRYFSTIHQSNKKIKALKDIQEKLSNEPKYNGKSLLEILELVAKDREATRNELYDMMDAIKEYELALGEANRELAEEVLASSGIEASVALNSSMKVLAKRYEEDKK